MQLFIYHSAQELNPGLFCCEVLSKKVSKYKRLSGSLVRQNGKFHRQTQIALNLAQPPLETRHNCLGKYAILFKLNETLETDPVG